MRLKHITEHPFIFATGLAAFVHSTWALGTLFAGEQPQAGLSWAFAGWIVPATLIAFALDVGQIVTAAEIRQGERSRTKFATFVIFAIATYYLQWLYMAHHMPALALSPGVAARWGELPSIWQDLALWIIPALLPLSTTLYTLGTKSAPPVPTTPRIELTAPSVEQIAVITTPLLSASELHHVDCPHCEWQGDYESKRAATNALNGHLQHCAYKVEFSNNGHK